MIVVRIGTYEIRVRKSNRRVRVWVPKYNNNNNNTISGCRMRLQTKLIYHNYTYCCCACILGIRDTHTIYHNNL